MCQQPGQLGDPLDRAQLLDGEKKWNCALRICDCFFQEKLNKDIILLY